jgi:phosphoglycolate phosphatase-like HAD superfamily hydrolase
MWNASGRQLAIVSNNSVAAVETYLDINDLRAVVNLVSARSNADLSQLKPSLYLVSNTVRVLGVTPTACTFVGDSLTDIEAARPVCNRSRTRTSLAR